MTNPVDGMERTPSWIFVAAVAVQLAALGLCAWVTDRSRLESRRENGSPSGPSAPPPRPRFAPPPHPARDPDTEIPAYVAEAAGDAGTQLLTGTLGDRAVTFGFSADGNIRFVDADGASYTGQVRTAHAELHAVAGDDTVTVRIRVEAAGGLQATISGGRHGAATFALEPVLGWNAA